jgi:hypothetical protein
MTTSSKSTGDHKASPVVRLAALGILGLAVVQAFTFSRWLDEHIAQLPVVGRAPPAQASAGAQAATAATLDRNIIPLLMESRQKEQLAVQGVLGGEAGSGRTLGAAFAGVSPRMQGRVPGPQLGRQAPLEQPAPAQTPVAPAQAPPALPDTFSLLRQQVQVQALTEHGAVINGRLFHVGEPVTTLSYLSAHSPPRLEHPTLAQRVASGVVLRETSGQRRSFTARLER